MSGGFDPVYMVPTCYQYLKQFPDVGQRAKFEYERLIECRLLVSPTLLTHLGYKLKQQIHELGCNHWRIHDALDAWPAEMLAMRRPEALAFVKLFQLDINDQETRRYIAQRLDPKYKTSKLYAGSFDWLGPMEVGLLDALEACAAARARLSSLL